MELHIFIFRTNLAIENQKVSFKTTNVLFYVLGPDLLRMSKMFEWKHSTLPALDLLQAEKVKAFIPGWMDSGKWSAK